MIEIKSIAGAIFDAGNEEAQIAFKQALFRENMYGAKFNLVPVIEVVDTVNTYEVEQTGKFSPIELIINSEPVIRYAIF